MKKLVTNYTFNVPTDPDSPKTITFQDFTALDLERILLITNVTKSIILYNFASLGGSVSGNVLTLSSSFNAINMSNSDKLQIFYDYPEEPWFAKSNTYFETFTIAKKAEAVAYTGGDVYGTKFELKNFGPASGGGILLTGITLVSSVTGTTFPAGMGLFTVYLFSSEPLGIADNAAFTIHNDSFTQQGIPLNSLSLVTNATNPSSVNYQINTVFMKGDTPWWGYVVTDSAFTPTNNTADTMTIILSGMEA